MTTDVSLLIYNQLCRKFGTAEVVKIRRLAYSAVDSIHLGEGLQSVFSGSKGEGLDFSDSDLDIMFIDESIKVYEQSSNVPTFVHGNPSIFIMDMEDTKPGFTKLKLHGIGKLFKDVIKYCCIGPNMYLSNTRFKSLFRTANFSIIHGPCLSDPEGKYDFAYTLHCEMWVTPAQPWIFRPKQNLLCHNMISNIIQHGVLFVPIGVRGSKTEEFEWRISFSVAEKQLIFYFSHTQLLCYALLKLLLKDIKVRLREMTQDHEMTNLLCSYFLKTVIFWVSEEVERSFWKPENINVCFMLCLKRLIYCVQYGILPHYFIPCNNLFENRFNNSEQKLLLCVLNSFYDRASQFIYKQTKSDSREFEVENILSTYHQISILYPPEEKDMLLTMKKILHNLTLCNLPCEKEICLFHLSLMSQRHCQSCSMKKEDNNKPHYLQYRHCVSHLLLALCHNSVSGWLLLASFFYKMEQYEKSLLTIRYALNDCTKQKFYSNGPNEHVNKEFHRIIRRRQSLVYITRRYVVDCVKFTQNSMLIPEELKIDATECDVPLSPVLFGHFLMFLCYHKLCWFRRCADLINDMCRIVTKGHYFFSIKDFVSPITANLMGIAFQMVGAYSSAKIIFEHVNKQDRDNKCAKIKLRELNQVISTFGDSKL